MLSFLLLILLFSAFIGLIASVYWKILSRSPLLNWWFRFGARYEKRWFFPPVWGCVKCIAGQMALWSYLVLVFLGEPAGQGDPFTIFPDNYANAALLRLFGLIAAICGAIVFSLVFTRVISSIENN